MDQKAEKPMTPKSVDHRMSLTMTDAMTQTNPNAMNHHRQRMPK